MTKSIVNLTFKEAKLKRKIRRHLKSLGYRKNRDGELVADDLSKDGIRKLHAKQRDTKYIDSQNFIDSNYEKLIKYFASGNELNPHMLSPRLEMVKSGTWQSNLFRLASLTWSIPVSTGYGRRIRFLVWDNYNDKLIGIIALGDPVFNLRVRDNYIGWNSEDRKNGLVNLMDAFVLGAVPPYNLILGGKLVASLIRSKEVCQAFEDKYRDRKGIISQTKKNPHLVIVTTSSALGRSSVYNRLKLDNQFYFKSIGYTQGWGHFHIPNDLFDELRDYLSSEEHPYASGHGFGDGPNWRLRTVKAAFMKLGLNPDLLKHGIHREVFICELASNAKEYLVGAAHQVRYDDIKSVSQISDFAKERWIIRRAHSRQEYLLWRNVDILNKFNTKISNESSIIEQLR